MMAVVFAFPETFGVDTGTEQCAFEQTFRTLAAIHDRHVDESALQKTLAANDFAPPDRVWECFSAIFGANPSVRIERVTVEAMFRNAGKLCLGTCFTPFDDVAPTLRELASLKLPQALISSGWGGIEQRRAAAAGFDGPVLVGEELGVDAFSPVAFARLCEAVRLPADRIWFVGTDVQRHIAAARAAGLRTVWLNRDGREFPDDLALPDHTICTFGDLLDVVREPYTRGLLALREVLRTALGWRSAYSVGASDFTPTDERPDRD
jgi:FMN phosphatase YigB (HAD superfamily)